MKATRYTFGALRDHHFTIHVELRDEEKDLWAIVRAGEVWLRSSEWDYEPSSSERGEAYLAVARWKLDEALAEATRLKALEEDR